MKVVKKIRSKIVVMAIAANFVFSPLSLAADIAQLSGKHFDQNRALVDSVMQDRNYVVEVDRIGNIKQVVDAGAKGSGKEAKQPIVSASSVEKPSPPLTFSSVDLPVNYQGQGAIDFIGADLPKIAENYGLTPDKLKELLLTDSTIRIDSNKHIFYIDDSAEELGHSDVVVTAAGATAKSATASSPELPIGLNPGTINGFKLHSKPGASKTIYLDFDGHTASNTAWSASTIVAPAYDLDGNPDVFTDNELSNIISIWSRVAEDYIPFDVDITTEAPSEDALLRTGTSDNNYGTRVVITKTGTVSCNCGGVAYLGVVAQVNNTVYQPAWVFQQSLANNEKYIAEAISHEAGHTLGLAHDGQKVGSTVNGYYTGHGAGVTGWAPIMGVGYYKNVTQWSKGAYPGANNKQDDLSVLASNGFVARMDDVGNTFATASSLSNADSGTAATILTSGVIESADDIDMYRIDTTGGLLNFTVKPTSTGPNLDIKLSLFKANGATVSVNAPDTDLSAMIRAIVPAGTYFLSVKGSAHAASGSDYGYPTYGSLGQYQITGGYTTSGIPAAPTAVLTASKLTGPASLTVNFSGKSSIGSGNIIGYQWSFGDGAYSSNPAPTYTYKKAGTYTATLTVTNEFLITHTQSVEIIVTPPPPVTFFTSSLRLSVLKRGSAVSATAFVTVVDEKRRPVPNAVVTGTWSGSFSGETSIKTGSSGIARPISTQITAVSGGSATFTVTGVEALGYVYNPDLNAKSVMTVAW